MNKLIISILSAGAVTLISASCVNAQDEDRMAKFLPTELFACDFRDGKGPGDLDAVVDQWTAYMDEREVDTYQALTLTRHFYTPEQDFDVLWLGASPNGNSFGQGKDDYIATGGAINAAFGSVVDCNAHVGFASRAIKLPSDYDAGPPENSVITFNDCTIKEGATYDTVLEGLLAWGKTLGDNGSDAALYQWWPVYGGGDADFDFKILGVYPNYASLGADFERVGNGELWRKRMELVGSQFDCDESRVYDARLRRAAQLR